MWNLIARTLLHRPVTMTGPQALAASRRKNHGRPRTFVGRAHASARSWAPRNSGSMRLAMKPANAAVSA